MAAETTTRRGLVRKQLAGRFNTKALYQAMDQKRRANAFSWNDVARDIGVSPSTLSRTRLGGRLEVDGMLAMVRWVGRSVESFTFPLDVA